MAVNMKAQVRELLARGYTEEQILSYFEKSYGQFVLLKPKFQGVNALVWILPIVVAGHRIRARRFEGEEAGSRAGCARPPKKPIDDPYLARVREMVEKS